MYIRRKVFSLLQDETGEERYFSTTDITLEDAEQRIFSVKDEEEEEKPKKRSKLSNYDSHRGLGRSAILGGLGGMIGGYASKKEADKADREGKSDEEIVEAATKKGRRIGAIAGGATGALAGANYLAALGKKGIIPALGATAGAAGWGALGGHLGAKKNAKERLKKRKLADSD